MGVVQHDRRDEGRRSGCGAADLAESSRPTIIACAWSSSPRAQPATRSPREAGASSVANREAAMQVGFYGKLPSHGDFLRRRVSDAFVDAWDVWLRECLAASRTALGARWLDVYLTSPAWRFVCAAGACGPAPVIGIAAPSVDQVGRYFPLTLVAELPPEVSLVTAASVVEIFRGRRAAGDRDAGHRAGRFRSIRSRDDGART